jgi:hypothetical protein
MDEPKLSDREAALIDAARRELASRASPKPAHEPLSGPATGRIPGPELETRLPHRNPAPAPAPVEDQNEAVTTHRGLPAARPDAAARIAALMQAEQEETSRRKKKLRQYGVVIPAVLLIAATLWVVTAIFRYVRI